MYYATHLLTFLMTLYAKWPNVYMRIFELYFHLESANFFSVYRSAHCCLITGRNKTTMSSQHPPEKEPLLWISACSPIEKLIVIITQHTQPVTGQLSHSGGSVAQWYAISPNDAIGPSGMQLGPVSVVLYPGQFHIFQGKGIENHFFLHLSKTLENWCLTR